MLNLFRAQENPRSYGLATIEEFKNLSFTQPFAGSPLRWKLDLGNPFFLIVQRSNLCDHQGPGILKEFQSLIYESDRQVCDGLCLSGCVTAGPPMDRGMPTHKRLDGLHDRNSNRDPGIQFFFGRECVRMEVRKEFLIRTSQKVNGC